MNGTYNRIFRLLPLIGLLSLSVAAAERTDFIVNDDGGVAQQTNPRIAVSDGSGFVVTWVDRRGETADVYLQRYDTAAMPTGDNIRINDDTTASYQFAPAVSANLSGRYAFAWTDYREGDYPFNPNIACKAFDTSLQAVGAELNLTQASSTSQKEAADISLSPYGGGVVVWSDYRKGNWDIYGQMITDDGEAVGGNFRIDDDITGSQQHAPRVSVSPDGWFVVVWYDNRWGDDDILFQMYDADGNKVGVNIKVTTDAGGYRQAFPDVACDGNGHFTIVWVDWRNGMYPANPDIYSGQFDTMLVALTGNLKINTDNSGQAQREPVIAADRMGNVAIIWADSSATSWDITGQMIDADGVVREANFRANSFGDSLQIRPDVALDGRYRYVTWADKRNGNFDIYASVNEYNNPSLGVFPSTMTFQMPLGGAVPSSNTIVVDHVGYNPIDFSVIGGSDWVVLSALSGTSPESLTVTIATDTLPVGAYLTTFTFVDVAGDDSSATLTVRLDVTQPPVMLTLAPDTLSFTVDESSPATQAASLDISISGDSSLVWTAAWSAAWMALSHTSGIGSTTISVVIDAADLDTGLYVAPLEISATGATNSPDTAWVMIDVMPAPPELAANPASFLVTSINYQNVDTFLVVSNIGGGLLSWQAASPDSWLAISPDSGSSGDTIWISQDTSLLSVGMQATQINIVDTTTANDSVSVLFVVDVIEKPEFSLDPDSLFLQVADSSSVDTFVIISNIGLDTLAWQAQSDSAWLEITPALGTDGDTIYLTIADTSQAPGIYVAHIEFTDSTAITPSVVLPVVFERLALPTTDTITFADVQVATGQTDQLAVTMALSQSTSQLFVPVTYDTSVITVDSVVFAATLPASATGDYVIDSLNGLLSLSLTVDTSAELTSGHHSLAEIMFTAGGAEGEVLLQAYDADSLQAYIISVADDSSKPDIVPGTIMVSAPTGVEEQNPQLLPQSVGLSQNYPNPFNLSTVIEFQLPRAADVKLEVFNILGQRLTTLVSGILAAGIYREAWNGKLESGRVAPSGIYFYRLRAGGESLIRKMALIK